MPRRFRADDQFNIQGIDLRIRAGSKFPGDLVLEQWNGREWCLVKMSQVLLMVAFIAENEDARRNHASYWKENGGTYFLKHVVAAVRDGWEPVAAKIERQRAARF